MDIARLLPARFSRLARRGPRVPVIRLDGVIGASARPGATGLSDASLAPLIERAFKKNPTAVALVINSPGGSPVQSSLIAARIRRLAEETGTPVHAFVEDVAASGGYWLACAADDIWADPTSIVGSIGVISSGFGLHEFIAKHGIERRVHTAGASKSFMDPFKPEKPEDLERLTKLLEPMHASFKAHVVQRRGVRLHADHDIFTGDIWTGANATEIGLIDGTAHLVPKLRALYGDKVRLEPYARKRPFLSRFGLNLSGADFAGAVMDATEERAIWARFGL